MKTKTNTTFTISKEEICEAIKMWALQTKGVEVVSEIHFETQELWDPSDWHGAHGPIGTDVTGAWFSLASLEHVV